MTINRAEFGARAITGTLFVLLAWRLGEDFARTGRITDLLMLVGEGLVVILTVIRRHATAIDRRPIARIVTLASMLSPFLVRPGPVGGLIPETISGAIAAAGLAIVVAGKLSLGCSFGLLPANRGFVSGGVYRVVRHPIYLGYLLTHIPFLLSHPTVWNLAVLTCADVALVVRAMYEEAVMAADERYVTYRGLVKWRLVPGVY